MLDQIEGSQAIAATVAACRPQVVCAYPITPQTHIVESLGARIQKGSLSGSVFMNVESEFGAMSAAIGASAGGARVYTATSSQGLLYMAEAVYNAAGLGLPIVMTIANRAIGAPINIWNDHSDAMALRDSGWVQLYAADNQEAADLHVQAFRLAESLSVPVMVCMDGFVLTHAVERIDVPEQDEVDAFLPPFEPRQTLSPDRALTIGAMVGPDAFTEVRFLSHARMRRALQAVPRIAADFASVFGRERGALVQPYELAGADLVVVCQGSVTGSLREVVDGFRAEGRRVGALSITLYRPFPLIAVRSALADAKRVVVVDRAIATGGDGFLCADVRPALAPGASIASVIAGLGGRPVTRVSLRRCLERELVRGLPETTFLDLNRAVVKHELGGIA